MRLSLSPPLLPPDPHPLAPEPKFFTPDGFLTVIILFTYNFWTRVNTTAQHLTLLIQSVFTEQLASSTVLNVEINGEQDTPQRAFIFNT